MSSLNIRGVSVSFPFKPYQVQEDYMTKMIQCLQEGENGILESPTGTGKTLCLLCASLAWLQTKKAAVQASRNGMDMMDDDTDFKLSLGGVLKKAAGKEWNDTTGTPKIIYCSRTHSQLTQAMNELKRTSYKHVKATVIASRDQLCIHPDVKKEENSTVKRQICMSKVSAKSCIYYNNVQYKADITLTKDAPVRDIEDLVTFGNKNKCCPYFMARDLKNVADIIFMPYNYLIDSKARQRHGIELSDSIIIFDEAHNISSVCENSSSVQLKSQDLATAISEVTQVMKGLSEMSEPDFNDDSQNSQVPDFTMNDLALLKVLLCEFETSIDNTNASNATVIKDGQYLYEILQKIHVTYEKKDTVLELIEKISMYLTTTRVNPFQRKEAALLKFAELVRVAYSRSIPKGMAQAGYSPGHSQFFKVYLHPNNEKKPRKVDVWAGNSNNTTNSQGWILNFWCFNPGLSMEDLVNQNVRSIILTSGTLTPLDSFAEELGIKFNVKLENPHVVEPHQIWSGVVHSGPDRSILNSSYKNRSSKSYLYSLGRSIVNLSRLVPGGILVFFPSYKVMEDTIQSWQVSDIWDEMNKLKKVFSEPRTQIALNACMDMYYETINEAGSKGAIFLAVCRGKVSEGLDFANNYGRAVVITGIPYPPLTDQRVCLKKQYLDGKTDIKNKTLTGNYWYQMEATRAVNQAIGRVIRHKNDFGAVLFCDERFDASNRKAFLPSWLRSQVQSYREFGSVVKTLVQFFKRLKPLELSLKPAISTEDSSSMFQLNKYESKAAVKLTVDDEVGAGNCVLTKVKSVQNASQNSEFIVSYSKESGNEECSKTSLFDSLYENESAEVSETSQEESRFPKFGEKKSSMKVGKRKLKVVPNSRKIANLGDSCNGATSSKEQTTIASSNNSSESCASTSYEQKKVIVAKHKLMSAKSYMNKAKEKLSDGNFKTFTKSVQSYKLNGNFTSLVSNLASIFTEQEDLHILFRDFIMFVKPEHKSEFSKTCSNLIGMPADFQKTFLSYQS